MTSSNREKIIDFCREHYLDTVKVIDYFEEKLQDKEKPDAYLRKAFENFNCYGFEIDKNIVQVERNLVKRFQEGDFEGSLKYRLMIEEVVVHSLLEFPITCEEMEETLDAICEYCKKRYETTYEKFYDYLLKSKTLKKCSPPLKIIEKECEQIQKLFDDLKS